MNNLFRCAFLCVLFIGVLRLPVFAAGYDEEQELYDLVEIGDQDLQENSEDPYARIWLDDSRGELMMSMGLEPSRFPDLEDDDVLFRYKDHLMSVFLKNEYFQDLFNLTGMTGRYLRFILVNNETGQAAASLLFSPDELALALMTHRPGAQEAKAQLDAINAELLDELVEKSNAKLRTEGPHNSMKIDESQNAVMMSLLVGDIGLVEIDPDDEDIMAIKKYFLQQMKESDLGVDWDVFLNMVAATGHEFWIRLYEFPGESTPWTLRYTSDDLFIFME